jgi:hypothetical protein
MLQIASLYVEVSLTSLSMSLKTKSNELNLNSKMVVQ